MKRHLKFILLPFALLACGATFAAREIGGGVGGGGGTGNPVEPKWTVPPPSSLTLSTLDTDSTVITVSWESEGTVSKNLAFTASQDGVVDVSVSSSQSQFQPRMA